MEYALNPFSVCGKCSYLVWLGQIKKYLCLPKFTSET